MKVDLPHLIRQLEHAAPAHWAALTQFEHHLREVIAGKHSLQELAQTYRLDKPVAAGAGMTRTKHDVEWVRDKIASLWPGIGDAAVAEMVERLKRSTLADDYDLERDGVLNSGDFTPEHRLYCFTRMLAPVRAGGQ
jgi:hypothetical protein